MSNCFLCKTITVVYYIIDIHIIISNASFIIIIIFIFEFILGAYLSPAVAMVVSGTLSCFVCWNASLYLYGKVQTCFIVWNI
jgi:hypothetical protein